MPQLLTMNHPLSPSYSPLIAWFLLQAKKRRVVSMASMQEELMSVGSPNEAPPTKREPRRILQAPPQGSLPTSG